MTAFQIETYGLTVSQLFELIELHDGQKVIIYSDDECESEEFDIDELLRLGTAYREMLARFRNRKTKSFAITPDPDSDPGRYDVWAIIIFLDR